MNTLAAADGPAEAWPPRPQAWYALAVLMLAYVFSFIDRTILSIMVQPIQLELGLNDTGVSVLHGLAFAIFYTVAGIPIGWLVDGGSRRSIAAAGVFLWSLMTAVCGLAQSFLTLLLARIGVGVGEAALSPAAYSLISDYFPPARRSLALGIYSAGASLGAGVAFIGGGWLVGLLMQAGPVDLPLVGETSAWRLTFMIVGLPGILVAWLMYSVAEPPRRMESATGTGGLPEGMLAHMRARWRPYFVVLVGFCLINLPFNGLIAWGPTYLIRVHDASPAQAGLVMGLVFLGPGALGLYVGGWTADRLLARGIVSANLRVGVLASVFGMLAVAALGMGLSFPAACAALGLSILFMSMCIGAGPPALQLLCPNRLRGRMGAVYMLALNLIGLGLGPTLVALLTDYVFADAMAVGRSIAWVGVLAALGGAGVLVLGRRVFERAVAPTSL